MKFLLTYRERRADFDPAAAQRRATRLLNERAIPSGVHVHELLSRIGGGGGYAVLEAADAQDLQQVAALFSAFDCTIEPVVDLAFNGMPREAAAVASGPPAGRGTLPEMPASEPHEGAFPDDDVYDTED